MCGAQHAGVQAAGCRCRVKLYLSAVTSPVHTSPVSQSSIPGLVYSNGVPVTSYIAPSFHVFLRNFFFKYCYFCLWVMMHFLEKIS